MGLIDRLQSLYKQLLGQDQAPELIEEGMRLVSGQTTSIGNFRDNNEDRVMSDDEMGLFVVADGMGGQAAGEQASQLAIDIVPRELTNIPHDAHDPDDIRQSIKNAILTANAAIISHGDADPSTQNMGTTIVMGLRRADRMFVAHIGDSRAYVIRAGKAHQITTDHNLAQALFEANTISEEELDTHRFRHVLWKYLGSKEVGEGPDIAEVDIQPGDRFLLASDGLTGSVSTEELAEIVANEPNPRTCSERLVKLALDKGSKDNVTCIVVHVQSNASETKDPYATNPATQSTGEFEVPEKQPE